MYIDAHCHLTGEEYESIGGLSEVIARAQSAGVKRMICSGFDLVSSKQAAAISERFESVYFCAGFHPSELSRLRETDWQEFAALFRHEKCVAVGEIGLDYHFEDNPPRQTQREAFVRQLKMANEAGLPVVLHSRDAAQETLEILEQNAALLKHSGLLHCYSYSPEMAERFAGLGLYFSFGGTATFKNAKKVQESIQRIPAQRILSETDCPYLTPVPFRGVFPNEPKNVIFALEKIAELKNTTVQEMQEIVWNNAKTLFFKLK